MTFKLFTGYALFLCLLLAWANMSGRSLGFFGTQNKWAAQGPPAQGGFTHK